MHRSTCRYFLTPGGCRNGSDCLFSHANTIAAPTYGQIAGTNIPLINSNKDETVDSTGRSNQAVPSINELWQNNLGNEADDDGVYFYGAAGQFNAKDAGKEILKEEKTSYSTVFKMNIPADLITTNEENRRSVPAPPKDICRFFLTGTCKFGDYCRYSHDLAADGTIEINDQQHRALRINEKLEPVECAICIDPNEGSLYGILSHCNCKFCVKCIRSWRKDGINVSGDNEQVRLCPLCRTQSYFVVPSAKHVVGEEKDKLLHAYKANLAKTPCKYYKRNKDCPFMESCFYMHEPDGSKGDFRGKLLFNSRGERFRWSDIESESDIIYHLERAIRGLTYEGMDSDSDIDIDDLLDLYY